MLLGSPYNAGMTKKLAAEALGTFALVFAETGAVVVNDVTGGTLSHVGVALTFGLVVMAMIYALGDVSGCHLNPAVSLAFFVAHPRTPQAPALLNSPPMALT
jgi:glycerol uptake facilitator-like aquaporin